MSLTLLDRRYEIQEPVGVGGMGTVYRAYDRLESRPVALKHIARESYGGSAETGSAFSTEKEGFLVALTREFKLLASLRHPNIISVLDYGFDNQRRPFFTMELLAESSNLLDAASYADMDQRIDYLVQLLRALEYLHRRGVIHRDLKPANVLVTGSHQVKVLDFGLAMGRKDPQRQDIAAGTLAYMAPEQLNGYPATERSDLYAVGVMAYEMIAGRHPFPVHDITALIRAVVHDMPDMKPIYARLETLAGVLMRLLDKDSDNRYAGAYDTLKAISYATERHIPPESPASRESFLQTAQLVGRDSELAQLTQAIEAAQTGQGSLWLVGGESGVGKSRLVDEIRTRALVQGALVVIGRADREDNAPLAIWREPLRRVLLRLNQPDMQQMAILKNFIPDVPELIRRDVPDMAPLNGMAEQKRLAQTISDVFRAVANEIPVLLLLDDLQWAQHGLAPLHNLSLLLSDVPLMVIGSYRDDEVPHLPDEFEQVNSLHLRRLSDASIAELVESMLGEDNRDEQVINFLQRETEGNTFFLVEILRALAEDAGTLSNIGRTTLPVSVFAGGVARIVERRLERIPDEARHLLHLAALIGREIQRDLLCEIAGVAMDVIDAWLITCSDAAVLTVEDDTWRFSHDKLRQGVIKSLDDDTRAALHGQVADGYVALYGDNADYAGRIADHYHAAGATDSLKQYVLPAARQANRVCLYQDVLRYAGMLSDATPELAFLRGNAHEAIGNYEAAQASYEASLRMAKEAANDTSEVAALNGLSVVHWRRGMYDPARRYAQQALELAEARDDKSGMAFALNNLGICASDQSDFDVAQAYYTRGLALRRDLNDRQGIAYILNSLGIAASDRGDDVAAVDYFSEARDVAAQIGDRHEVSFALQGLSIAQANLGQYDTALDTALEALSIAEELGGARGIALALYRVGAAKGHLGEDISSLDDALQIARQLGDVRLIGNILYEQALFARFSGEYELADSCLEETIQVRQQINDTRGLIFSWIERGRLADARGHVDAALEAYNAALSLAQEMANQASIGLILALRAMVYLRDGAVSTAETDMQRATGAALQSGSDMTGAHVLLSLAEYYAVQGEMATCAEMIAILNASTFADYNDIRMVLERLHRSYPLPGNGAEVAADRATLPAIDDVLQAHL